MGGRRGQAELLVLAKASQECVKPTWQQSIAVYHMPRYALAAARRALAPGGRLLLVERYDSLESPRAREVEHPLARLRRLLTEAGLTCERMSPIEADGQHVLAAAAVLSAQRPRGTASAA